ncbi:MAG: hypothetical protein V1787_03915 [Candidatus Micrarchaeota archaeon]
MGYERPLRMLGERLKSQGLSIHSVSNPEGKVEITIVLKPRTDLAEFQYIGQDVTARELFERIQSGISKQWPTHSLKIVKSSRFGDNPTVQFSISGKAKDAVRIKAILEHALELKQ